jgi:putative mRNA 3-end processing factor
MSELLIYTSQGIYCPKGDFYIDPWKPVHKAIVSHAHADHAIYGHAFYFCHNDTKPVLKHRLGNTIHVESYDYGHKIKINDVIVSLHPAGHVIGSCQIRVEYKGYVEVFSGDFKTINDNLSMPFEPLKCNHFISESTFGLPVFNFKNTNEIENELVSWVETNKQEGMNSVIFAYSLGKAQRIAQMVSKYFNVFVHSSIYSIHNLFLSAGYNVGNVENFANFNKAIHKGVLIIMPPMLLGSNILHKADPYLTAYASGWMQIRGNKKRINVDKGLVISDHADFKGILETIAETNCEMVSFTHGYADFMSRYVSEKKGIKTTVLHTNYIGEDIEGKDTAYEM